MGKSIQSRLSAQRGPLKTLTPFVRPQKQRPTTAERGYDAAWQKLRKEHLAAHPACVTCGKIHKSNHVDHIIPHKGNDTLRLDRRNLQTKCHSHHSSKTATHDGGFGHRRKP